MCSRVNSAVFYLSIVAVHRGSEEGPWADELPFDGRDVWQFTLEFDDHMHNKWVIKQPDLFHNLGSDRHPRCWPWSNEDELPYERPDRDCHAINTNYPMHICLGPFGCDGKDHSHNFAGAA